MLKMSLFRAHEPGGGVQCHTQSGGADAPRACTCASEGGEWTQELPGWGSSLPPG